MAHQDDLQTIGTPVTYWGVIKDNGEKLNPFKTITTSKPWQLGHGSWVVKIEGKSGGMSIKHIDVDEHIPPVPFTEDMLLKLLKVQANINATTFEEILNDRPDYYWRLYTRGGWNLLDLLFNKMNGTNRANLITYINQYKP